MKITENTHFYMGQTIEQKTGEKEKKLLAEDIKGSMVDEEL